MKTFIPSFIVLILAVITVLGCISSNDTDVGILEGNISIGPICPVEHPDLTCVTPPEAYEARKILIFRDDGKTLVKTVTIGGNGHYHIELNPGSYIIDINHVGIDRSADVPASIVIRSGKTVTLNVMIDTGIR
jgi:hypothetical protein